METSLKEGYRQVGEGAEESDQDGGGSRGYSYEDSVKDPGAHYSRDRILAGGPEVKSKV